jgi:hypothetical protein
VHNYGHNGAGYRLCCRAKQERRRGLSKTTGWNNIASKSNSPGGTWPRLGTQERIGTAPCSLKSKAVLRAFAAEAHEKHESPWSLRTARRPIAHQESSRQALEMRSRPLSRTPHKAAGLFKPMSLPLLKSRNSLKHGGYSPLARLSLRSRFLGGRCHRRAASDGRLALPSFACRRLSGHLTDSLARTF